MQRMRPGRESGPAIQFWSYRRLFGSFFAGHLVLATGAGKSGEILALCCMRPSGRWPWLHTKLLLQHALVQGGQLESDFVAGGF